MDRMAFVAVQTLPRDFEITGPLSPDWREVLTHDAMNFVAELAVMFEGRRQDLLERRRHRQVEFDAGTMPGFLPETERVRKGDWKVAPIPADLLDRRVEITGPVDRKMIINALNSGANVFMADFEDSNSPTWANVLEGQLNLRDAVRREITYVRPDGKRYEVNDRPATLFMRPRGWHLCEKHVLVEGQPISASLFDFGLYMFHNAAKLVEHGTGPYFYLPKLESHLEARLWNDVFLYAQERLDLSPRTIRATVLIETILAAFEMDEILYELRDHSAGLNCGRWDYIFSFIKKFRYHREFVLPDRAEVTMERHFLKSYVDLLIQTCHRRGIHAMGGMAAQIPIKTDPDANAQALEKVRADKLREVRAGHDGTWVAHPGLVPLAKDIFDEYMPEPNQIWRRREGVQVTAQDLLTVPVGSITEAGLRRNIDVGIRYLESWLRGGGCVPIYNLMEDAATAEICRVQVWQWVKFNATLEDGRTITGQLVADLVANELKRIRLLAGVESFHKGCYRRASKILEQLMTAPDLPDFLTSIAYEYLD